MADVLTAFPSLADLRAAMDEKRVSSAEITQMLLRRIDETEPTIGAYITVDHEGALAAAAAMDAASAAGYRFGPLHGIPIAVKDLYNTKGMRTTAGGRILKDFIPSDDASAVLRLRQAGAIIVGKTNTHEYAYGYTTENPHYGATRNPWDTTRIAGGSSGGSGASIAIGSAIAALGSDTGGSIRVPSSFCGITGLKPTYGRVSRCGVWPLSWTLDHAGPMARTVKDVAIMMQVLAGYDSADPAAASAPVPDYSAGLRKGVRGLRIGVPRKHFFERVDHEVERHVNAALEVLQGEGALLIEIDLAHIHEAVPAWLAILLSEAASIHETNIRQIPSQYGDDVRTYLEVGALVPASIYLKAQRVRRLLMDTFKNAMTRVDVIVTPATPLVAPGLGETEVTIAGQKEALFRALARISSPLDMVGLPTLALPCGFNREGLPIGMQIVAKAFDESMALRVGDTYESSTEWTKRHPHGVLSQQR